MKRKCKCRHGGKKFVRKVGMHKPVRRPRAPVRRIVKRLG